ncbi:hypothetical protein PC116_g7108 [Phytophthora cactorum]|nr:hypothetical protein PC114_g3926 [Phytophthora cactorum]KAG3028517.1 hypothetical protein PC120_g4828 [Phytophthora cactorum]KAG3185110.1 hypothetical protein C6341_g4652 [Phytophthora cactorum]KAG4060072.1 hypothetical protein PC123_g5003 [Phytophthora cactorum]KAG4245101.1 hypothetical protein PC116_g7108 [Phytophthora cactorum]
MSSAPEAARLPNVLFDRSHLHPGVLGKKNINQGFY